MTKVEFIIINVFLGITCPLITFAVLWWTSATLYIYGKEIPLIVVKLSAISGLIIGILLDVFFLRRWVSNFYLTDLRIGFVYYLFLCAISVAFLMGLPIGTMVLGIGAGIYMGRRLSFSHNREDIPIRSLRNTALVAAFVTFSTALPIGILVKQDFEKIDQMESLFFFFYQLLDDMTGYLTIVILCSILFCIQYWFSNIAGIITFRICTNPTN